MKFNSSMALFSVTLLTTFLLSGCCHPDASSPNDTLCSCQQLFCASNSDCTASSETDQDKAKCVCGNQTAAINTITSGLTDKQLSCMEKQNLGVVSLSGGTGSSWTATVGASNDNYATTAVAIATAAATCKIDQEIIGKAKTIFDDTATLRAAALRSSGANASSFTYKIK